VLEQGSNTGLTPERESKSVTETNK
jgi:hypothetical protein